MTLPELTLPPRATTGGSLALFVAHKPQRIHRVPILQPTLLRVLRGTKRVFLSTDTVHAEAGQLLALPAGCDLNLDNLPASGVYAAAVVAFSPDMLDRLRAAHPALAIDDAGPATQAATPLSTSASLDAAWAGVMQGWQQGLAAHQLDHRLLELLLALAESGQLGRLFAHQAQPVSAQVRLLLSLDPAQDWQMAEVAQRLHRSEATLRRQLSAEGRGWRELLEEVRMVTGLGLVQTTALTVNEVAARCGYDSPSRFAARFRARFGLTPSELR